MAEKEEFTPKWDEKKIEPGTYIWMIYVKNFVFRESVFEGETKPYGLVSAIVEDPPGGQDPLAGLDFDFRVYLNPKSAWKCLWFLKKFDYPQELLADENKPIIRRGEVVGLHGKVLAEVKQTDSGYLQFYVNGFDRVGGEELEKKLAGKRRNGSHEAEDVAVDTVEVSDNPVVDLEEDIKHATPNTESRAQDALDDL